MEMEQINEKNILLVLLQKEKKINAFVSIPLI